MQLAYADPPYPGCADYYEGHPDFGGEVDHVELARRLLPFDGWALSTSARALPDVLAIFRELGCVPSVAAWHRYPRPNRAKRPRSAWEPVIYFGGRHITSTSTDPVADSLIAGRHGRPKLIGQKPAPFAFWIFELLGARAGDELADLFPGTGTIGRAWELFERADRAKRRGEQLAAARDTSAPESARADLQASRSNGSSSVEPSSGAITMRRGSPAPAGSTLRRELTPDHGSTLELPFDRDASEPARALSDARGRHARARAVLDGFYRRRDDARKRYANLRGRHELRDHEAAELRELELAIESSRADELEALAELELARELVEALERTSEVSRLAHELVDVLDRREVSRPPGAEASPVDDEVRSDTSGLEVRRSELH